MSPLIFPCVLKAHRPEGAVHSKKERDNTWRTLNIFFFGHSDEHVSLRFHIFCFLLFFFFGHRPVVPFSLERMADWYELFSGQ